MIETNLLKKTLLLLVICCIPSIPLPASAITPRTVAVLPAINIPKYENADDIQVIQDTIKKPFKYPYYTLLPTDTAAQTTQAFLVANKSSKLSAEQSLSYLADKLSADIVIVVELSKVRMSRFYSPRLDETYIESDIELKCYAYSALSKKYNVFRVSKSTREPESINTNASFIFKELTEEILARLPYKRIPADSALF